MTELLVRSDSSIDMWMSNVLVEGIFSNLSTPSVYLAENGSSYFCWMNDLGEVRGYLHGCRRLFTDTHRCCWVPPMGSLDVPLLLMNHRPLALFGDGANLKMARMAFEGQVYTTDTWLKRTIVEDLFQNQ